GRRLVAAVASRGREHDGAAEALGRQPVPQERRMSGLGAALVARRLLGDGLGGGGRVGGGRQGGVGGVGAEAFLEGADQRLQFGDTPLEFRTAGATRLAHTLSIRTGTPDSCAPSISGRTVTRDVRAWLRVPGNHGLR